MRPLKTARAFSRPADGCRPPEPKHQEAKMTFQFSSLICRSDASPKGQATSAGPVRTAMHRRVRLVARWRRAKDSRLECRWYRSPD